MLYIYVCAYNKIQNVKFPKNKYLNIMVYVVYICLYKTNEGIVNFTVIYFTFLVYTKPLKVSIVNCYLTTWFKVV